MTCRVIAVGLEVHVQLQCRRKLFSPSSTEQPGEVTPLDHGTPGYLPVLDHSENGALKQAVKAVRLLQCRQVAQWCAFDRKHYAYGDLPLGYQITQQRHPLGRHGQLAGVAIRQVHLEQDTAARSADGSLDYRRSGLALVEIVTEPMLYESEKQASAKTMSFVRLLANTLRWHGVTTGRGHEGALRVDLNFSIHGADQPESSRLTPRVELKNLNGVSLIEPVIDNISAVVGGVSGDATFGVDQSTGALHFLRPKMPARDYRYMPDPDLRPIRIKGGLVPEVDAELEADGPMPSDDKLLALLLQFPLARSLHGHYREHPKLKGLMEFLAANHALNGDSDGSHGLVRSASALYVAGRVHDAKQLLLSTPLQPRQEQVDAPLPTEKVIDGDRELWLLYVRKGDQKHADALIGRFRRQNPNLPVDPGKLKQALMVKREQQQQIDHSSQRSQ
jgi:Glu-tRNA(Gln) amidotransferase subunit E-like FAD-binding protein